MGAMSALEDALDSRIAANPCWCCGNDFPERQLVRLSAHPEAALCLRCARFLLRLARTRADEDDPVAGARLRSAVRSIRKVIVGRRWHERPVVGPVLRWIDKHLP